MTRDITGQYMQKEKINKQEKSSIIRNSLVLQVMEQYLAIVYQCYISRLKLIQRLVVKHTLFNYKLKACIKFAQILFPGHFISVFVLVHSLCYLYDHFNK